VAVWVTWIESMSCPFIKWADSNGRNSNSTTRWKTFSLQLAKRLNKLAGGFGPRGSKFTDYEIPSGWFGEESDRSKVDFTYPSEEKISTKPRRRMLLLTPLFTCQAHHCSSGTGYGVILNPWTFPRGTPSVPAFVVHASPEGFATDQRRGSASTSGLTNARLFQAFLAYLRSKAQDWK
jgi:hypothetical protein